MGSRAGAQGQLQKAAIMSTTLDIDTCAAEARTLHPSNDGWFATLRKVQGGKPIHLLHHMSSLDAVVRALDKQPDVYVSQASFMTAKRQVAAFKSINCAFVDIDCYSSKPNSPQIAPDDAFIERLLANARNAGFPEPSYVTLSGRGVYCKWVFDRPISAHQLTRWQALQNVLTPLYTAFGVDASARDAARVLRVMGSAHSEAGNMVRVGHNTNRVHSFDDLCCAAEAVDVSKLVWPTKAGAGGKSGKPRVREAKKESELLLESSGDLSVLVSYAAAHEPVMLKLGTRDHLNWARFIDLRTLAEIRGGIHAGSRDLMMFWMGAFLGHSRVVTSANLAQELGSLIGAFDGPGFDPIADGSMASLVARLKEKEAGRVVRFKGGEYDPLYTPTNAHLIDVLCISEDEQGKLATIISGEEKLRRADAKAPGRTERRQARVEWRGLAREMAREATEAGETQFISKIAREVGVDRKKVSRLLAGKLDRDPTRVETRGRKKAAAGAASRMVQVVVARHGSLTKSVWVPAGKEGSVDVAAALAPRARPAGFAIQYTRSANSFSSLAVHSREHAVFSISREGEREKGALALQEEKKAWIPGGPEKNFATSTSETTSATNATISSWTGWGSLVEKTKSRKPMLTGHGHGTKSSRSVTEGVSIRLPGAGGHRSVQIPPPAVIVQLSALRDFSADPGALRAEAMRLTEERKVGMDAARTREQALLKAEREQAALKAVSRIEEMRVRAMARGPAPAPASPKPVLTDLPPAAAALVAQLTQELGEPVALAKEVARRADGGGDD